MPVRSHSRRSLLGFTAKTLASTPVLAAAWHASAAAAADLPQPPAASGGATTKLPPFKSSFDQQMDPPQRPLAPSERVGFALVGLGNLTVGQLLPAFAESKAAKVTAFVSGSADKAKALATAYGVPQQSLYSYDTFDEIAHNPAVQVVYIVLPNGMHKEFTRRAAAAGKHVLCEKPMANSPAEAQEMIDACKAADRKLMIAYRQQYEPYNEVVREMIRNETYGKVKFIDAVNAQVNGKQDQWRYKKALAGGGSLPDVGLYCLNACRFLTGQEPMEVQASLYSMPDDPRFREVEETVAWQMRFPSGLIANCASSYGFHEDRRYRIHAERGWFGLEPAFAYNGLRLNTAAADGKFEVKQQPALPEINQFTAEIDHMAHCVLHDRTPRTGGEEGLQDHKIMAAIYEAAATGRVVKLPRVTQLDLTRGSNAFG